MREKEKVTDRKRKPDLLRDFNPPSFKRIDVESETWPGDT